ncbi:hypothetical protein JCM8097_001173 [Rhodosporidiobolus ruineniae]
MHRALRTSTGVYRATRAFSSSSCSCQSSTSNGTPTPSTSTSDTPAEPSPAYSLPLDAFSSTTSRGPSPSSSRVQTDRPFQTRRPRQRQYLTDSEAQAFADLLGEILPKSMGTSSSSSASAKSSASSALRGGGGIFDILAPQRGPSLTGPRTGVANEHPDGVGKVQAALMRKVGLRKGAVGLGGVDEFGELRTSSMKGREELTEEEALRLDALRQEALQLRTDRDVLLWAMRVVFGFGSNGGDVFPDPARLDAAPRPPSSSRSSPSTPASDSDSDIDTVGPSSPLYAPLLHLTFLLLRDTHSSPLSALSLFHLAASNPYSYITGCTSQLYTEVLRTRWAHAGGDLDGVLATMEEMRAAGVAVDAKAKELVRSIGEAIRLDEERAEARVDASSSSSSSSSSSVGAEPPTGLERDRALELHRFFGPSSRAAWARMESIVEEVTDELAQRARDRRAREAEEQEAAEAALAEREAEEEGRFGLGGLQGLAEGLGLPPSEKQERGRSGARFGEREDEGEFFPPSSSSAGSARAVPRRKTLSPYDDRPSRPTSSSSFSARDRERDDERGYDFGADSPFRGGGRGREGRVKRPSYANPFKIRRGALTREEKAGKDDKHPALWWKQ